MELQGLYPPPPPFYQLYTEDRDGSAERPLPPEAPPPITGEYAMLGELHTVSIRPQKQLHLHTMSDASCFERLADPLLFTCWAAASLSEHGSPTLTRDWLQHSSWCLADVLLHVLQTEVGVPALQTEPLFSRKADGTIGEPLQCAADPVLAD